MMDQEVIQEEKALLDDFMAKISPMVKGTWTMYSKSNMKSNTASHFSI